jgi:hypothetical protein
MNNQLNYAPNLSKLLRVSYLTVTLLSATTMGILTQPTYAQSVNFICTEDSNNIPTTYAQTPDGGVEVFKWVSNFFPPPYTPKQRCEEITQRLNNFQPDHLVTGRVNNYNVICAGTSCDRNGSNVLLTLTPSQNPQQMLAEIDANRDGASGPVRALGNNGNRNNVSALSKTGDGNVRLNLNQYISNAPKVPLAFSSNSSTSKPNNSPNNSTIIPETSPAPKPPASEKGTLW